MSKVIKNFTIADAANRVAQCEELDLNSKSSARIKIISEKIDEERGIWQPTIAFNFPQNLTQYTLTITKDMIRGGICPLVFVRELVKCFDGELEESPKKNQV